MKRLEQPQQINAQTNPLRGATPTIQSQWSQYPTFPQHPEASPTPSSTHKNRIMTYCHKEKAFKISRMMFHLNSMGMKSLNIVLEI